MSDAFIFINEVFADTFHSLTDRFLVYLPTPLQNVDADGDITMGEPDVDRDIIMAEVVVVPNPGLGGWQMNNELRNPSTTPPGTPPRYQAGAILHVVRAPVVPPAVRRIVAIPHLMAEVEIAVNPGLGGLGMEKEKEPTNTSTMPPGTPPRQRVEGRQPVVRASATSLVPRRMVATYEAAVPKAAYPAATTTTTSNSSTALLTPAQMSEAARMRAKQQRLAASATRKEDDKQRARARHAEAVGQA